MRKKIAFIGVGNMAQAIISGITARETGSVAWSDIILFNRHREKIEKYSSFGSRIADTLNEAVDLADCIILCVKPQNFCEILPTLSKCKNVENKLFISIAAGIGTEAVSSAANGAPVVRVMPNTPLMIGQGVSALCRNSVVSDEDFCFACDIFSSAGTVITIDESEMNKIICVTGSSPAYVFMLIKAMYDGACMQGLLKDGDSNNGLTSDNLITCICDTIIGSAMLMKCGNKTPDEQIATVASKGGTTERAISELERYNIYEAVSSAMKKCTDRAEELGKKNV